MNLKNWWIAICTEFKNTENEKVQKIIKKTDLPSGRKLYVYHWIFVLKDEYPEYVKENHKLVIDKNTHCLKLEKALYGLVQAARQWWKKFKEVMRKIGYSPSPGDPCLFT